MLLTKEVEYRGKMIPIEKLSKKSSKKLLVKCPSCGEIREVFAKAYFREETGLCHKCSLEERAKTIPVGTIFGQWVVIGEGKQNGKSLCRCNCGNEREVRNSSLRLGKSTSCGCSLSQARQSQRKHLETGAQYGRLTVVDSAESGYSLCVCKCGNEVKVSNWNLEHGITKSCGCLKREKAAENMRKSVKCGEEHPNWKGGISTEYQRTRATKQFKDFLKTVRERDNHQCQKCGVSKSRMHVHHIKPVRFYPELMSKPDNGVLLCPKCHREFHKLHGKDAEGNELKEYLSN